MRKSYALLISAWVLTGAAGCQDTWAAFGREERNLKNELADYMIRVVDEETAQYVVEGPAKKLKDKWDDHKDKLAKYVKGQDLGQLEAAFKQLQRADTAKMGIGPSERTFKKDANGQITMEGPAASGSLKEAIDTLCDLDYAKAMQAAESRLREQERRVSLIRPSGLFLQKAQGLPKGTFGS